MEKKETTVPASTVKYFQWALQGLLVIIGYFILNLLTEIKDNTAKIDRVADRVDTVFFQEKFDAFMLKDHETRIGNTEKKLDNTEKRVSVLEAKKK